MLTCILLLTHTWRIRIADCLWKVISTNIDCSVRMNACMTAVHLWTCDHCLNFVMLFLAGVHCRMFPSGQWFGMKSYVFEILRPFFCGLPLWTEMLSIVPLSFSEQNHPWSFLLLLFIYYGMNHANNLRVSYVHLY